MPLSTNIRTKREELLISPNQLAQAADANITDIYDLERGRLITFVKQEKTLKALSNSLNKPSCEKPWKSWKYSSRVRAFNFRRTDGTDLDTFFEDSCGVIHGVPPDVFSGVCIITEKPLLQAAYISPKVRRRRVGAH